MDSTRSDTLPPKTIFSSLADNLKSKVFADDRILDLILAYYFLSNRPTADKLRIRLVNKRFSLLSLPHILHTISVDNISALVNLVSAPYSPLYHRPFSIHVRCFELGFLPYRYKLVFTSPINHTNGSLDAPDVTSYPTLDPFICENLEVVRFKFKMGTPLYQCPIDKTAMKKFNARLYQDSIRYQAKILANVSWFCFLSKFSPRRFEWTLPSEAEVSSVMYFLGLHRDLKTLLRLWNVRGLCVIYLSGVCLVEQSSIDAPWCIALLAQFVQVSGPWLNADPFIASELGAISTSRVCKKLVLEERVLKDWYFADTTISQIPSTSTPATPASFMPAPSTPPSKLRQSVLEVTKPRDKKVLVQEREDDQILMFCFASILFFLTMCFFGWLTIRVMVCLIRFWFWVSWSLCLGPFKLTWYILKALHHHTVSTDWITFSVVKMGNLVPQPTIPITFVPHHPITIPSLPTNTIPSRHQVSQSIKYASKMCPGTHQSKAM
ncbi:hypothetical protein BJ165DRAFT_1526728 [Panaeolus papilionaceus]|nr:hypothetical protein BJ165DRAFT_1526728 [Panaeolus papilionaceus]